MIRMLGRCCSARRSPSASLLYQFFSRRIPLLVLFGLTLVGSAAAQFTINTVAGNGQAQAPFKTAPSPGWMSGVAADASGNVFIAVSDTNVVMQLDPKGNFTVVAGTGAAGFSGDGGLATSAQLNTPVGVALDAKGNLYIADSGNQRVREVSNGV